MVYKLYGLTADDPSSLRFAAARIAIIEGRK